MDDFENRPFWSMFTVGARLIIVVLALTVIGTLGYLAFSPFFSAAGVVNRTLDPQNVIANYEWFRQQYADVSTQQQKISIAEGNYKAFLDQMAGTPRSSWTSEDKAEADRLNTIIAGTKQYCVTLVADYNARSKMANRNIFSGDLPTSMDPVIICKGESK